MGHRGPHNSEKTSDALRKKLEVSVPHKRHSENLLFQRYILISRSNNGSPCPEQTLSIETATKQANPDAIRQVHKIRKML